MLQSDLCDHSDAYFVVKGTITVRNEISKAIDGYNRNLILKNNASFTSCISNINNVLFGNVEDLDVAMPIYNPFEYSKNYRKTTGILTWPEGCVIINIATRERGAQRDPPEVRTSIDAILSITDTKLYVPVVTHSTQENNTLLQQLKTRFKQTIKWNKYRSETSNWNKNNNLNYLIDPTLFNVKILSVLSFENENDRIFFKKYYMSNVEIKNFNVLMEGERFLKTPIKIKEEACEKIIEI